MLRADNPGPMTLDGTRSYVLRAPGAASCVVVDPGPPLEPHLAALADAGPVALALVTHRHADHTGGLARFRELTGAPSRGALPEFSKGGADGVPVEPLSDGEVLTIAGLRIEVLTTPGHTADSVCLVVSAPGGLGNSAGLDGAGSLEATRAASGTVVLTGDTVLGQGTTVLAEPDGSLRDYLASLDRLSELDLPDPVPALPGHGPVIPDLGSAVRAYREHRLERLDQVRSTLANLGARLPDASASLPDPLLDEVTGAVYADVDASVLSAARSSVRAQLEYLRGR
ncbi:MBL fold metallo-hydrolase [Promicromonospora panici]|uniref:MBL fold metallo-hydrolase n=1 Tax=Promicromonospora panici TaxID=2219658 RepID=UPI00101D6659|nr:MBL fold metallo-hydrolase [Promicromonospora panici]